MNGKILILDDDRAIQASLFRHLTREGFHVTEALNAAEALRLLRAENFDLLLLDLGLPDVDGVTFCRRLRADWKLPVLILTARSDSYDKVVGLEVGADDYVTKPFDLPELLARIRALLRRNREYSTDDESAEQIRVGRVIVDAGLHDATVDGRPVGLTDKEFDVLWLLARHQGRAVEKYWLFEQVWGYDAELGIKMLAVYIRRIRQKIEKDPDHPVLIQTLRGHGYRMSDEAQDLAAVTG